MPNTRILTQGILNTSSRHRFSIVIMAQSKKPNISILAQSGPQYRADKVFIVAMMEDSKKGLNFQFHGIRSKVTLII